MSADLPRRVGAVSRPDLSDGGAPQRLEGELQAVLDWSCVCRHVDLYDLETGHFVARVTCGAIVSLTLDGVP